MHDIMFLNSHNFKSHNLHIQELSPPPQKKFQGPKNSRDMLLEIKKQNECRLIFCFLSRAVVLDIENALRHTLKCSFSDLTLHKMKYEVLVGHTVGNI